MQELKNISHQLRKRKRNKLVLLAKSELSNMEVLID